MFLTRRNTVALIKTVHKFQNFFVQYDAKVFSIKSPCQQHPRNGDSWLLKEIQHATHNFHKYSIIPPYTLINSLCFWLKVVDLRIYYNNPYLKYVPLDHVTKFIALR